MSIYGNSPNPVDSIDIRQQTEDRIEAQEKAAEEAAAQQALIDMQLGPAANDKVFQDKIRQSFDISKNDWEGYYREELRPEVDRLTSYEDALRQGRALYQPEMGYMARNREDASRPRVDRRTAGGQGGLDPRAQMRADAMLPPLDLNADEQADLLRYLGGLDTTDGPAGPAGPRGPSIYDMERGLLDRTFASQLEGFGDSRDLVGQLADMREKNIAGQEQFSRDKAAGRETFLGETDERRKANAAQAKENREQRKTHELARQQTQLDAALRASGIDKNAASSRLSALGIDPGNFADADMSETTAMLYSQNMSAASFVNQMDGVAEQAAEFAKNANDQAGAAALFGIGEDLSFALQSYDQARNQGLIDDAQAMYGIAAAERQARQAQDTALTTLDVNTKRAAQAAAAAAANRAAQKAEAEEMMAAGVISTQAIMKLRAGESLTSEEYMAIEMVNRSDDAVSASGSYVDFQTDERRRVEDDQQAYAMAIHEASLRPPPAAEQSNRVPIALATGEVVYLNPTEAIAYDRYLSEEGSAGPTTQYFTPYQPPAEG